jgi:hypothetical protein
MSDVRCYSLPTHCYAAAAPLHIAYCELCCVLRLLNRIAHCPLRIGHWHYHWPLAIIHYCHWPLALAIGHWPLLAVGRNAQRRGLELELLPATA